MDEKKKVYVETSVISNLTAHPSRSVIDMGHQVATYEWWTSCQGACELYSSAIVEREASKGDAEAAALRMEAIAATKTLPVTEAAIGLAEMLLRETAVPRTSFDDALHIAVAAVNRMDFLVTWNCKHIANAVAMPKIYKVCQDAGYSCQLICTPEQMKGE